MIAEADAQVSVSEEAILVEAEATLLPGKALDAALTIMLKFQRIARPSEQKPQIK
jgi:hypothetical protein